MSNIVKATKVERIGSVVIKSYDGTIDFHEDDYNRGATSVVVNATDPRAALLDQLLRFAQPQADECPVREITLQAVIDEMQSLRDKLNENWGPNIGEPRKLVLGFNIDADDAKVVKVVLTGGEPDYAARETMRKALAVNDSGW